MILDLRHGAGVAFPPLPPKCAAILRFSFRAPGFIVRRRSVDRDSRHSVDPRPGRSSKGAFANAPYSVCGVDVVAALRAGCRANAGHHHRRSERFHGRRRSRRHGDGGEQGDQRHPYRPRATRSACSTFRRCRRARTRSRPNSQGFKTATQRPELQVQQTVRVNFTLELGTLTETATVTGVSPLVETSNATVGTVIENRRIVELPLNGRNYLQLDRAEPERQRRVSPAPVRRAIARAARAPTSSCRFQASAASSTTTRSTASTTPTSTSTPISSCRRSTRSRNSRCRPASTRRSSDARRAR